MLWGFHVAMGAGHLLAGILTGGSSSRHQQRWWRTSGSASRSRCKGGGNSTSHAVFALTLKFLSLALLAATTAMATVQEGART